MYAQPVNRRVGRRWAAIDNTLVPSGKSGFAYENRSDSYTARLPEDAAGTVRVEGGEDFAEFRMLGAGSSAQAQVKGDKVTYSGAMPGADVAYEATAEGLRETVTLANAAASVSYEYALRMSPGSTVRPGRSGELQIAKGGKTIFSLAAPIVYDAKGRAATGRGGSPLRYSVSGSGSRRTIRLRFDRRWLSAPGRAFPVTVDPTITYTAGYAVLNGAVQDTFIQSDTPDSNYNAANFLRVGRSASPAREQRALLKFDVNSAVPQDSVVYSAQLAGYLESAANTNAAPVSVREVGRSWTEAATWNRHDGSGSWTTPGADLGAFASNG